MDKQSRLAYTIDLTLFSFLMFIIYKANSYVRKKAA